MCTRKGRQVAFEHNSCRLIAARPGGARIKAAPAVSGQKISHSERPKVYAT